MQRWIAYHDVDVWGWQELQRDMWEVKLKLQRSEDGCTAAEEKTLCLESFVREGLGSIGRVLLCHMMNYDALKSSYAGCNPNSLIMF